MLDCKGWCTDYINKPLTDLAARGALFGEAPPSADGVPKKSRVAGFPEKIETGRSRYWPGVPQRLRLTARQASVPEKACEILNDRSHVDKTRLEYMIKRDIKRDLGHWLR